MLLKPSYWHKKKYQRKYVLIFKNLGLIHLTKNKIISLNYFCKALIYL